MKYSKSETTEAQIFCLVVCLFVVGIGLSLLQRLGEIALTKVGI